MIAPEPTSPTGTPPLEPKVSGSSWDFLSWFLVGIFFYAVLVVIVIVHLVRWLIGVANNDPRAPAFRHVLRTSSIALLLATPVIFILGQVLRLVCR